MRQGPNSGPPPKLQCEAGLREEVLKEFFLVEYPAQRSYGFVHSRKEKGSIHWKCILIRLQFGRVQRCRNIRCHKRYSKHVAGCFTPQQTESCGGGKACGFIGIGGVGEDLWDFHKHFVQGRLRLLVFRWKLPQVAGHDNTRPRRTSRRSVV
jgi:hypothetical protein